MARDPRIDDRADEIVASWRELCRFPTVAGRLDAIAAAADWIEERLAPLMDRVVRYDIPGYGPVVVGFRAGASDASLLLYNHYDVQPEGDPSRWTSPPYAAEIRDGAMYARGACDDKADVAGRLASLRLWIEDHDGQTPFGVIYLADREEDGRPAVGFGCRGSLEIELSLDILAAAQHPSYSSILRSAPLELMAAISSMRTDDGRIAVAGVRDEAIVPDERARRRTADITLPGASIARDGVTPYLPGTDSELSTRFVFEPSMSLSGFDLDDGVRQSIPASASARVRLGLVPGMQPERVVDAVRAHLFARHPDISVSVIRALAPAYSPVESAFGEAVVRAAGHAFGADAVVYDVMTGAGPGALFLEHLGAPIISPTGTLRPAGNMHGYDEHGYVEDFLDHVQFTLDVLRELERSGFADTPRGGA
ncbi:MAG: hypothetical protein K0S70_1953 [Microbacterium sp.]|nr:hypothetical protein [Microbacterium sp.]